MKKYRLIGIIALTLSLALFSFILFHSRRKAGIPQTDEPQYDNMTVIGTRQGSYHHSTACQSEGGAVLIASIISPEDGKADKVSIIKLSPEGDFLWEQAFALGKKPLLHFLKHDKAEQSLRTLQISFLQNHYYVVLTSQEQQSEAPSILRINQDGSLLEVQKVDLELASGTSIKTFISGDKLYLSYIDSQDKMLSLSQIDLLTAEVLRTSVRFIRQKNLVINDVAADPADSIVSVVAYDKQFGCSFFQYTPKTDLKEVFRTQIATDIKVLRYENNMLYGAVIEDSLLKIIDLTDLGKPLVKVSDVPSAKDFRLIDLHVSDIKFHVLAKTRHVKETGAEDILAELLSYNFDGSLADKKEYESSDYDHEKQILALPNRPTFILGESSGGSDSNKFRIFLKN